MAAMIPLCMLQNIAQPQRNPASGENAAQEDIDAAGFRKADASSAQTSAPKSVRTPAHDQTSKTPAGRRVRAISDGCTKIDAPMIVPATIAVAFTRVSEGRSPGAIDRDDLIGETQAGRSAQVGAAMELCENPIRRTIPHPGLRAVTTWRTSRYRSHD